MNSACGVPGCPCGGLPQAAKGVAAPPARTPRPVLPCGCKGRVCNGAAAHLPKWKVARGKPWRVWRAYHDLGPGRPPRGDLTPLCCPEEPWKVEKAQASPGATDFYNGGGPYTVVCPCGKPSRYLYTQMAELPVSYPGARWEIEPWPGMEES